jgi:hypothetical protein
MMGYVERFVDDDRGYGEWLGRHPDGFVLNTGRTPSAAYLVLHRAACGTISGRPARGATFTGEYAKICGTRDELEDFARELGGRARPCGLCSGQDAGLGAEVTAGRKYDPLRDHLAGHAGSRVRMTFTEVEDLVGQLPGSAYRHRAWWGNNDATSAARAWLATGWRVESVSHAAAEVVFTRAGDGQARSARRAPAGRPAPSTYVDPEVSARLAARAQALGLDPGKLERLVAELNDSVGRRSAYASHALLRALLDHIPPLLGCPDFRAAASSYPWGRTDRSYARRLLDFRLQADDALHRQISRKPDQLGIDDMPPRIWVNRLLQECADPRDRHPPQPGHTSP